MGLMQMLEGQLMLFTGGLLVACISVLTLYSFSSASAVQYDTLLLSLLSLFISLKILSF